MASRANPCADGSQEPVLTADAEPSAVPAEQQALRNAAMLLAAWTQANGYDAFRWRGILRNAEGEEPFSLQVRLGRT